MNRANEFEKLNERKEQYVIVDDDTIIHLKNYYRLEGHDELLQFIKDAVIVGDEG
ncbi:hypothetical protein NTE_00167 [Candidatus Nitrososphaera evergladensis SR1]|jgi:16S rRNA U1498 N3-methylase RsmE|uniref:Uncharacterized protein n=1 Tax=Candidatus Nitrososphaera evergladensis SR1 TaxID=1459636 RepID=A0A075MSC1_9ARCH|nr:hypothetical protein [Candidatus Nitrososphaera evergladensis]AIF82249.1 hypothetical protein NTE_00167 [Candidatus Nitrososphaera evergladensis SR1]